MMSRAWYHHLIERPSSVVVGIGTNDRLSSRLVRRITRSDYSHAWVEYGETVYHAQSKGVIDEEVSEVWKKYPKMRRFRLLAPSDIAERCAEYAETMIGIPYDYNVIGNGIRLWWYFVTGRITKPEVDPYRFHCVEFAIHVLREAAPISKLDQLDPELTYPGKLLTWLEGHTRFKEI